MEPICKKVKQWLEELPNGYRELALGQVDEAGESEVSSFEGALLMFADWANTNEKEPFWAKVFNHYKTNGINPLPPLPTT